MESYVLSIIAGVFHLSVDEITEFTILKKGMTNHSFTFSCRGNQYIIRVPGEGTDKLINRRQEAEVYNIISNRGLCDDVLYLNSDNGYKISKFLHCARVCDSDNVRDLERCMKKLHDFHDMKLSVSHEFDIFRQIDFYESLWNGKHSCYSDYQETKLNVLSLKEYISKYVNLYCLCHIDAVPDNFLFYVSESGKEELRLTDWEYAGMQDPHIDIAMFCIYSLYDKTQVDRLIDIYFKNNCSDVVRTKIYCYIAACGLLWSNWCEYKRSLGIEFGEYSLCQYRYAKEYYQIAKIEMEKGK